MTNSFDLWHRRMSYPPSDRLNRMKDIISFSQNNIAHICDISPLAEQTLLPFRGGDFLTQLLGQSTSHYKRMSL